MNNTTYTPIPGSHCQQCGSNDPEDLDGHDGYSRCCNEIVVWSCQDGACYHAQDKAYQDALNAATANAGYGRNRLAFSENDPAAWQKAQDDAAAAEAAMQEAYELALRLYS